MSDSQPAVLAEVRDSTLLLTLNRPDKINAMNGELYGLLHEHIRSFARDDSLRVAVITGAGGNFSSGGDLAWFQEMQAKHGTDDDRWSFDFPAYQEMKKLNKPIIAAIDGYCLASGFNLAVLYSDIRIASTRAKLGIPGPRRGLGVGSYPMPWNQYASVGNILYMTLTGLPLSAEQAYTMGFVSEVVEADALLERALELASLIAEGNPLEVEGLKEFWRAYPELPGSSYPLLAQTIRARIDAQGTNRDEGKRAFLEKRKPVWN